VEAYLRQRCCCESMRLHREVTIGIRQLLFVTSDKLCSAEGNLGQGGWDTTL